MLSEDDGECLRCGGTGKVVVRWYDSSPGNDPPSPVEWKDCPDCNAASVTWRVNDHG